MNLEVITKNVDFDTYKNFDLSRLVIINSNATLELLEIKNLKDVPALENFDVMIYLYNCVIGMSGVLEKGYRLHQANHIIDVVVGRVPDTTDI